MDDVTCDGEARKRKLHAACKKHGEIARAAGKGEGIDRHLLGTAARGFIFLCFCC